MTSRGVEPTGNAVERVFKLFGKRWTGIAMTSLMGGPAPFSNPRRTVPGISARMLSDRLTELRAAGLVTGTGRSKITRGLRRELLQLLVRGRPVLPQRHTRRAFGTGSTAVPRTPVSRVVKNLVASS
ncbi:helix-turn-helix domain-containing protein [Streptomyces sp. NK15101]|uniref:winged helix-turn-helix transcriptional regulator n=1 Tax=Streptomyces sp. NK15101 TaxID=2873261 RepID=UPI001CED90F2|nr:winged helix-turn-helix transcriptional regulator [Streptomyces sp. NK15101]